jgi:glycolate oxidase
VAESAEEQALLWKARRTIPASLFRVRPHRYNEDIVVPRSRIPEMVEKIQEIATRRGLTIASFGHAGDGNIHVNVLFNKEEEHRAHEAVVEIFHATAALEGRITGEHGVGLSKRQFFHLNVDAATTRLMRGLKNLLDPKNTLNPHKMFPEDDNDGR